MFLFVLLCLPCYIYKYDAKGNLIECITFAPNTKPLKTIYKYDAKGNMISAEGFSEEGKIGSWEKFKINGNGNVSEHAFYLTDTNIVEHSFTYLYDKNHNIIQKDYFKPGVKSMKYKYIYEYDKTGNWIKHTDFENDKAVIITERKL